MTNVATDVNSFVSCTGERLLVEYVRDLPPNLADWRQAVLADVRQRGLGRASIRAGRCLMLDDVHAALEFAADDPLITVWSDGTYSDRYFAHLLRDHVVPRRLALRGERILHANAVEFDGFAVAFVGASTAGKSTLAAAGVRAGGRLLADDTLRLVLSAAGTGVLQTATRCRLRADVADSIDAAETAPIATAATVPLGLVCILERGAEHLELVNCTPAAALVALSRASFMPEACEVDRASVLDLFIPVVEQTPVATLRYPNGLRVLPDVVEFVRGSVRRSQNIRTTS